MIHCLIMLVVYLMKEFKRQELPICLISNENISVNYLRLQMRTSPVIAISRWSKMLENKKNLKLRTELFDESFKILNDAKYSRGKKKGLDTLPIEKQTYSFHHLSGLQKKKTSSSTLSYWRNRQTRNVEEKSYRIARRSSRIRGWDISSYATCIHLEDDTRLAELGSKLASLASRQNQTGINAINLNLATLNETSLIRQFR